MFINFYYLLKSHGVPVSITEWMMLTEALSKGIAYSSLTDFYYLSRTLLVKNEAHYDRYDLAFYNYFKGIETPVELTGKILEWLENSLPPKYIPFEDRQLLETYDFEALRRRLKERLEEQKEAHHGGNKWVGTGGTSPFGHSGYNMEGIRIEGKSTNRSAVKVAALRKFKGFRSDAAIGVRQFEIALRKLRKLSTKVEGPRDELDIEETIRETGQKGGNLQIVWSRGRKNMVKILLLMDSGGSMNPYMRICSQLFTALNRSTHLKDLKFFYFHNCIYQHIYTGPDCQMKNAIKTEDFLKIIDADYKIIIMGDASMAPSELTMPDGSIDYYYSNKEPGIVWLQRIADRFNYSVWLNPIPSSFWDRGTGNFTLSLIRGIFPMFDLTVEGLDAAIKKLKTIN